MKIAIYSDKESMTSTLFLPEALKEGLDGYPVEIIELNRHQLQTGLNQSVDLFVVPGILGEVCDYYQSLSGQNAQAIQRYVEEGGGYLGICAGGYYAMSDIQYRTSDGAIKTRQSPFGLIQGIADGPVEGENLVKSDSNNWGHTGVRPMVLKSHFANHAALGHAIYSSGPAFYPQEHAVTLASYGDHKDEPTSLIAKKYGKGLVMASGTAPYYNVKPYLDLGFDNINPEAYKANMHLKDQLLEHDKTRSTYWKLMLHSFAAHRFQLAQSRRSVLSVHA